MGYGYSLLPTSVEPTSTMTFRLTPSEKRERDNWILGAVKHGLPISEIAFEVGLSVPRVKQIIKQKSDSPDSFTKSTITLGPKKKFKTPRDAAVAEFVANSYHIMTGGACKRFDYECMHCLGSLMMIESEYDANGWPYSWAMYGQEKYIAQCS